MAANWFYTALKTTAVTHFTSLFMHFNAFNAQSVRDSVLGKMAITNCEKKKQQIKLVQVFSVWPNIIFFLKAFIYVLKGTCWNNNMGFILFSTVIFFWKTLPKTEIDFKPWQCIKLAKHMKAWSYQVSWAESGSSEKRP